MRMMSFMLTTAQVRDQSKTVTRRLRWNNLKSGDHVQPVEKGMGLAKGEKVKHIGGPICIVSTRWETLDSITQQECILEGFPNMTPAEFVAMFCKCNKCIPSTHVNRIEFAYTMTTPLLVLSPEPYGMTKMPAPFILLAKKHEGVRVSGSGVLGRIRDGRYHDRLDFMCGEMLRHLEEMASRYYAGDITAVDEFLQLYCFDDKRPKPSSEGEKRA